MNDKILVRLMDIDKEDTMITAFYTTNWSETLKMYSFLKENDLSYNITTEVENQNYKDRIFFIKDITIAFGNGMSLNCIDIYVEVI